jgi:hypothetical protein
MVWTDSISGVPALALPKIRTSVGGSESPASVAGGVIDAGEYPHALRRDSRLEPVHRFLRPVMTGPRHQSFHAHDPYSSLRCVRARLSGGAGIAANELIVWDSAVGRRTSMHFVAEAAIFAPCRP